MTLFSRHGKKHEKVRDRAGNGLKKQFLLGILWEKTRRVFSALGRKTRMQNIWERL